MKIFLAALLLLNPILNSQEPTKTADENLYYSVPIASIKFTEGKISSENYEHRRYQNGNYLLVPRVVVEGDSEAYVDIDGNSFMWTNGGFNSIFANAAVLVRSSSKSAVNCRLFIPTLNWKGMTELKFQLDPKDSKPENKEKFLKAKEEYYERSLSSGAPGAAWFRSQANQAHELRTLNPENNLSTNRRNDFSWRNRRNDSLENSIDLFSGGRAIRENLQLDRAIPEAAEGQETVAVSGIEGINVRAFSWKELIAGKTVNRDPLASFIPEDQYALLFPSFSAMSALIDEADREGTPILNMLDIPAEDMKTKARYERQLCLEMSTLARLLGPEVIDSVAMTGSDPFLVTGTDVAVLFQTKPGRISALAGFLKSKHATAIKEDGVKTENGQVEGFEYSVVRNSDRSICSYQMTMENCIVVSNSLIQLRKIAACSKQKSASLANLEEYQFFRSRYEKGDAKESALLLVTDPAIRNWCSPKWRIADSRRTRAAALMSDLQARNLQALMKGDTKAVSIEDKKVLGGGSFSITPRGVQHSVYGTLGFLTPIAELEMPQVTKQENDLYVRWREGYVRNWSNFFDPIAIRFTREDKRLALDMTVMPLIAGSEYRQIVEFTGNAGIKDKAGDKHPESLLHIAMALDPESAPVKMGANFARGFAPQLQANPFAWVGGTVALYVDEDPMWKEFIKSKDAEEYFKTHAPRIPVALWVEVKDSLGVTAFLTTVRAMIEQTAPDMTNWETLKHKDYSYLKITGEPRGATNEDGTPDKSLDIAVFYAVTPSSLIITLNEDLLKRSLDRMPSKTEKETGAAQTAQPWLGKSLSLQARSNALPIIQALYAMDQQEPLSAKCWNNLAILNEWKRLFPDKDPVQVHEQIWGTTLLCPGGGKYVWNEKWQTMESTVYGHPGEQKAGPQFSDLLKKYSFGNFGITFENQGLRAQASVDRE